MKEHSQGYRQLVSNEPISSSFEVFRQKIKSWFAGGREYQFLVYVREKVVGTIFFYCGNKEKRTIKISCFFTPEIRKRIAVAESLGMAISFAFHILHVRAVLFDVYENNASMLDFARKLGAIEVGTRQSAMVKERRIKQFLLSAKEIVPLLKKLSVLERFY